MGSLVELINLVQLDLPQIYPFVPVIIIAFMTALGWLLELTVLARLQRFAKRSPWHGDDVIFASLRARFILWGLLLGLFLALSPKSSPWHIQDLTVGTYVDDGLLVVFLLSLTTSLASISSRLINVSSGAEQRPALSLITTVVRVTIYIVGFLIILQVFDVSVTPALAALGVGGLAVSLALQSTLTDLISGIQLIAARQVRPGEYIRLSTGEEGYVVDINWRTTTVRQLTNNMIIIPNAQMTSSILVNYAQPQTDLAILLDIGVSYDADLERVERVTLEVAREVLASVPGGVADYEPLLRYSLFAESAIHFTVILRGHEFTNQFLIKHEFIKRLQRRYREEGIAFGLPVRVVHTPDARDPVGF